MTSLDDDIVSEVVSWAEVHKDTRVLARELSKRDQFKGIIAITRGGLIPAAIMARELGIKLIETVCVEAYRDNAAELSGSVNVMKEATMAGDGEGWLMIDDLVDTGTTAKAVREMMPKAYFVTLYAKPEGRPLVDSFVKEVKQETWVFFPWDTQLQYSKPIVAKND
ncbi:guanine-hypoxanthine phosphoribosyltransferase [Candidatus Terasakiella magnetica]|uniref:Guanine-hypoxanthine phosphoribosyltransferase n=1 Tax=Candidatus Terasakiella magnetica TaxID=1867952 RepID=A0A1C3REJ9_9PROT|nr:xanthine phosphoribosyltransferase [Candidatus Terasakiella magnetica]SCA55689.1 guanine-hypoxanthine phosphoribosyltransferase [Candidatus Terasakiella magnetica]